jgi:hypothetical protein
MKLRMAILALVVACTGADKRPDEIFRFPQTALTCPPGSLTDKRVRDVDGNGKVDFMLDRADDGEGHDVEVWCLDETPPNPTPEQIADPANYHFATALSHPGGAPLTWFALCLFNQGQNEFHKDGKPAWQGARWDNIDPKEKPDYAAFNDIHYSFSWSSGTLKIQLTKNGEGVGSPVIVPKDALTDEEKFEKAVFDLVAEAGGGNVRNGSDCRITPR